MLGDKVLELNKDNLVINGKQYTGTMDLYELIFMSDTDTIHIRRRKLKNFW